MRAGFNPLAPGGVAALTQRVIIKGPLLGTGEPQTWEYRGVPDPGKILILGPLHWLCGPTLIY